MELIGEPHAPAVLFPGKEFPLPMPGFELSIDQPVTYSLHRQRHPVSVVVVVAIKPVQNFINSQCYLLDTRN